MLQVSALGINIVPLADDDEGGEGGGLKSYPTVQKLQNQLAEDHSEREFADGLDDLIERVRTSLDS